MRRRCLCPCHDVIGEPRRADGVDVTDPMLAVSACVKCQNDHCAALSDALQAQTESGASGGDATGYTPTDNGEGNYLPPQPWSGEEGG